MDIYIIAAERRLLSANSVRYQDIRPRLVPRQHSNARCAVEKVPIKLLTRDAQYTDENWRSCDHHHYVRTNNGTYASLFRSSTNPPPATYGCPYLGRLAISDIYGKLYFSLTAAEERGFNINLKLQNWDRTGKTKSTE